jgi:NIMA (never in mitosis gene a)-related kinase
VFKVKRLSDGEEYAMKKVKLAKLSTKEKENALNEIRILASVVHKNIIGYKEAFFDEITNQLCIVMEIANGGDLDAKIT